MIIRKPDPYGKYQSVRIPRELVDRNTFIIIEFIRTIGNNGRCVRCDARNYCGVRTGMPCPCNLNQQLILSSKTFEIK